MEKNDALQFQRQIDNILRDLTVGYLTFKFSQNVYNTETQIVDKKTTKIQKDVDKMNGVINQQTQFQQEQDISMDKLSLELEFMENEIQK